MEAAEQTYIDIVSAGSDVKSDCFKQEIRAKFVVRRI